MAPTFRPATSCGTKFTRSKGGYESVRRGSKRNRPCGRFAERLWYFGVIREKTCNLLLRYRLNWQLKFMKVLFRVLICPKVTLFGQCNLAINRVAPRTKSRERVISTAALATALQS